MGRRIQREQTRDYYLDKVVRNLNVQVLRAGKSINEIRHGLALGFAMANE
jgi:hypothetical protein